MYYLCNFVITYIGWDLFCNVMIMVNSAGCLGKFIKKRHYLITVQHDMLLITNKIREFLLFIHYLVMH